MKWLAENQIKLQSDIFTPNIIIGLKSDTLSNTEQYFYFLVARYFIWSCKIKEVIPKIGRFSSCLSSFVLAAIRHSRSISNGIFTDKSIFKYLIFPRNRPVPVYMSTFR